MSSVYKRNNTGPYIVSWFDATGRRREKSSRTTDKRAAQRLADKLEAAVMLRREGIIDARQDRFSEENRKPLAEHAEAYLAHCRHVGRDAKHIVEKTRHLSRLIEGTNATRLSDLLPDPVERYLASLVDEGLAARTINFRRQVIVTLMNWCVKTGRIESNPLSVVPKLDESRDRRRVRRPLTNDDLVRLLEVGPPSGPSGVVSRCRLDGPAKI